ncbi:MAG: asparagine synthase-related protein [Novosphingobium sp.]
MTALATCLSWSSEVSARNYVERMLRAQSMFGPDNTALDGSSEMALGRNLMRMLPEDVLDRQPVDFAGGRYQLVADIRLDNRDDLHSELALSAQQARLLCDAAVLAAAFERWGIEDTLPRLAGVFAIAVRDRKDKTLTLVRDPSSYRPLYYFQHPRFLAASSMLKGLFALADVPRELNETWLAEYVSLLPHKGPVTFFRDISRVEPGRMVRLSQDKAQTVHWCDLSSVPEQRFGSFDETLEALDDLMQTVVRAQTRSIGGVGSHLSGGLDSGVVTALSAKILAEKGKTLSAYTAAPRAPEEFSPSLREIADESPQARQVAALFPNIEHRIIFNDANPMTDVAARYIGIMDEIPLNPANLVWMDAIQRDAHKQGISTILNGIQGNITFSAGFELTAPEFRHCRSRLSYLHRVASLAQAGELTPRRAMAYVLHTFLPPALFHAVQSRLSRAPEVPSGVTLLKSDVVSNLDLTDRVNRRYRMHGFDGETAGHGRAFLLQQRDHGSLMKAGQALNRIDERDVCSDLRIVKFCLSVPIDLFSHGHDRALAKALYQRHLSADRLAGFVKGRQAADSHRMFFSEREKILSEIARATAKSSLFQNVVPEQLVNSQPDTQAVDFPFSQQVRYSRLLGTSLFINHINGRNS